MIGDFILWFRRVKKEMFCIHDYEWRDLTRKERSIEGNEYTLSKLVCKKCGRGEDPYC